MFFQACFAQEIRDEHKYLKQKPPGIVPEIFMPGLISLDVESEFGSVFNSNGTSFYYGVYKKGKTEIRFTELVDGEWSKPITILSDETYGMNDPFLSPDEQRLYFISQKAIEGNGAKQDHDIWYVERANNGWSEPINAGSNINSSGEEYYISFTNSGTMYFSSNKLKSDASRNFDIYSSQYINNEFQEPVLMDESINTKHYEADVFIDPDERYIIFCGRRPEGMGKGDLYISFKKDDGSWTTSINMGDQINTEGHELCPFVTKDGKYFLYTSNQDIYWVNTAVIEQLRLLVMK